MSGDLLRAKCEAAADLPAAVTKRKSFKWAAEAMLARFYLTRSGVESNGGARKQEFLIVLNNAADVINNGPYALLTVMRICLVE